MHHLALVRSICTKDKSHSAVGTARDAGCKYIVLTSKHHDGFCLWDSKQTDYTVSNTPFKRDVVRELSDECRKQGVVFCLYHSIADWHHPDYGPERMAQEVSGMTQAVDPALIFPEGAAADLAAKSQGVVGAVAEPLFRTYLIPFEVTSILLLAAIVGAVVLAKRKL